jgi:hypothetical protein
MLKEDLDKTFGTEGASMDVKKLPIDRILQKMQWGNIAFNAPTSMNLEETARLRLLLGIKQTIEELEQDIKIEMDKAHLSGGIEGARTKVAPLMQAHLEGSNFDVKPIPQKSNLYHLK